MHKIDALDAVLVKPTKKAVGSVVGYFTDGDPGGGVQATVLDADWCNSVQDEILNVLAAASVTPDKTDDDQLLEAIRYIAFKSGFLASSTDVTLTDSDNYRVVEIDCTSGNRNVYLPLSANNQGREIIIIRKDSSSNTLTINRKSASSDTLQGTSLTSFTIDEQGASARMIPNGGTVWYKV